MILGDRILIGHTDLRYLNQSGKIVIETPLAAPSGLIAIGPGAATALRPVGIVATRVIAIGEDALALATATSQRNIAIGRATLGAIVGGVSDDIAIGDGAAAALTAGAQTIAIGSSALATATTGTRNVVIGYRAGTATNTSDVVIIGANALELGTVGGTPGVFIGANTARVATGITTAVVIGYNAMLLNAAGPGGIVAIGHEAMGGGTGLSSFTTAVGYRAGFASGAAANNTLIGCQAGVAITTSQNNVLMGFNVALNLSTAGYNTILGSAAAPTLVSGIGNVVIGARDGGATNVNVPAAGSNHYIIIGAVDLASNAETNLVVSDPVLRNVHVGPRRPGNWFVTTGVDNIAIGDQALMAVTTGSRNVAIGTAALSALTVASDQTVIGYGVAPGVTGNGNLVLGAAGGAALTTGTNNTVIGTRVSGSAAPAGPTTSSFNVILGAYDSVGGNILAETPAGATGSYVVIAAGQSIVVVDPVLRNLHFGSLKPGNWRTATGFDNQAFGDHAMAVLTTGVRNIAQGSDALGVLTTGSENIAIGYRAMNGAAGGTAPLRNTVVGSQALRDYTGAAANNVVVGRAVAVTVTDLQQSVLIGGNTMSGATGGTTTRAVLIGYNVASSAVTAAPIDSVIIGHQGAVVTTTAQRIVVIGSGAAPALTTGDANILVGFGVAPILTTGTRNVVVGQFLAGTATTATLPAAGSSGYIVLSADTDAAGANILISDPVLFNLHFGPGKPGNWLTATGADNQAFGRQALDVLTTGARNIGFGSDALGVLTTGTDNTAIGYNAMLGAAGGTAPTRNVVVGKSALAAYAAAASDNVIVGVLAAQLVTNSVENVLIGLGVLANSTTATAAQSVLIGARVAITAATAAPIDDVFIGYQAAGVATTAQRGVVVGSRAAPALTTGLGNILMGYGVAPVLTTGARNIVVGQYLAGTTTTATLPAAASSGYIVISADQDAGNGANLVVSNPDLNNLHFGPGKPGNWLTTSGVNNLAIGARALDALGVGTRNLGFGTDALGAITNGDDNIAIGNNAMNGAGSGGALRNLAIGSFALDSISTAVTDHVAVGYNAGTAITTAVRDTIVGASAGVAVTTGDGNVLVGFGVAPVLTTGARNVVIGQYLAGTSTAATLPAAASAGYIVIAADTDANGVNLLISNPALNNIHFGTGKPGNWLTATGTNDIMIGARAMDALTSGARNIAIGTDALGTLTTGSDNIGIGASALISSAAATARTVVIGSRAADAITGTAADLVVLGNDAAGSVTNLATAVVIGSNALAGATGATTARAVIIGHNAAANAATAAPIDAVIIGYQAALATTTAVGGTIIGSGAGAGLTTGSYNTLIGFGVAPILTTGRNNVVIGAYQGTAIDANLPAANSDGYIVLAAWAPDAAGAPLGYDPQTVCVVTPRLLNGAEQDLAQSGSVFIGADRTGNWLTSTGNRNIGIGARALQALTTGVQNVVLGNPGDAALGAGGAITTGQANIVIGPNGPGNITTGSLNILIGSGVTTPAGNTSSFLNLGGALFGDLANGDIRIGGTSATAVAQTERLAVTDTNADTVNIMTIETTGANGAKVAFFCGTQDPNGTITGNPGDIYFRANGVLSRPYVNTGAGAGTTWVLV